MGYRSTLEKPYMTMITALFSYRKKIKGVLFTIVFGMLVGYGLVGAVTAIDCILFERAPSDTLNALTVSAHKLFDFIPYYGNQQALDQGTPVVPLRILGFLFTCILSGMLVANFLAPRQVIRFAPYAVINTAKDAIQIRFRIAIPVGQYLSNAKICISISDWSQRRSASLENRRFFQYLLPQDLRSERRESYAAMRGVWDIDIPLKIKDSKGEKTLRRLLTSLASRQEAPEGLVLDVYVAGVAPNGDQAFARHKYSMDRFLLGYGLVPIWRKEFRDIPGSCDDPKERRAFFPEHFNMVYKIDDADEIRYHMLTAAFGDNRPDSAHLLEKGRWIERWWGPKRFLLGKMPSSNPKSR